MSDASANDRRPLLIVAATVHLDTQWRWTIQETIAELLPRTLSENFALFETRPSYVLGFEGAFRYMLAEEYYPEAFEELLAWSRRGRWRPVGAMLDAPDVNIVAPESLIRHVLYGNGYFADRLGERCRDLFLPDCFGFGYALPSIAAHCGLESISTSKLIKWKRPDAIPLDVGRWCGPDGAEILAVLRPGGYGEGLDENLAHSERWLERLEATRARCGVAVGVRYMGTGDRGGSPDDESLDQLEESLGADGPIEVRCAPAAEILDHLDSEARGRLPLHDDEILLPTHGTGCWTSQAALKRWNRSNELLGGAAERAAVVADWLGASPYPRQRLAEAWRLVLWHQMHDDLTGTSIPAAYRFTWNDEAVAANLFAGVLNDAVAAVASYLDTRTSGVPLVVYNPLLCRRQDVVEVLLSRAVLPAGPLAVLDPEGDRLPLQIEPADGHGAEGDRLRLLFPATVAPLSLAVFQIVDEREAGGDGRTVEPLTVSPGALENHRFRVEIDAAGDLASIVDRELGRELLAAPHRLELFRDRSRLWPAWEIRPETLLGARGRPVDRLEAAEVTERGPVRVAVALTKRWRGSTLRQVVRLASGRAGDRVEVACRIRWGTRGRLLKASFRLAASAPTAHYDLGLGAIERDNNSRERYEVPAQQWAELTDASGEFGAAILNDSKYGWDKPADDELRLSLLRSPATLRRFTHHRVQDFGTHRFTYALTGHRGSRDRSRICHQAERLNQPLGAFVVSASPGRLGRRLAFAEPSDDAVGLMALKRAETGDQYVVRLRELGHARRRLTVGFPTPVCGAVPLRGDEEPIATPGGSVGIEPRRTTAEPDGDTGGRLALELGPSSLATVGFHLEPPAEAGDPPDQTPLTLPWNVRAAAFHDDEGLPVDFDQNGHAFPGELVPRRLGIGAVELVLGPPRKANAVSCRGQTISLPQEVRAVWLVAAAIGGPVRATFATGAQRRSLSVGHWTGSIAERERPARWGGLVPRRPGRLERSRIAWLATHRHRLDRSARAWRDEPYLFCYLFCYRLPIAAGIRVLGLPDEPRIHLFAATAVGDGDVEAIPARPRREPS